MNWNKRYANESSNPWPEDDEKTIDHMSTHHHGELKDIVTYCTGLVDQLGSAVPYIMRQTMINKFIKAHITEASENGTFSPGQIAAIHEYVHGGRTDGPERGHDFISVQSPEEVQRQRARIDHGHTTIPEL